MRTMKVRHQYLPGIGNLFELDTASGPRITITNYRSGRRDVAIGDPGAEEPLAATGLTRAEAAAVSMLLTGVRIELVMTARD